MTLAWGGVGGSPLSDLADLSAMGEVTAVSAPDSDPAVRRQRALDAAYRYLARRDRTVLEMRRHLEGRRVEPDAIEQAVAELCEQGYLDDARYARTFAEDRRALDGWGPDRIGRRLTQMGVDREAVEAALAARGVEDELAAAVEVLRQKLRAAPGDDRGRERALGLLARRGYSLDLAYDAVRAFEREA
ncbi:regulatory protein RecX [Capillimicrobium parvum]|uniref:Regulatory protein RecX n=1 Tax=Capillimicrobium parvum TaxID=2884022 RepID=A0A9E6XZ42_9ACTN|nr:RecX family transcriptional regulator [Capillimicrobium parvum]UGS36683.1 Regulatory protein RecX [Capillimicrobium parvum]